MKHCIKCDRKVPDLFTSLYGETMCEFCWDEYLMTDKGKVEYLVGIVRGDYPMEYYDADFLGHVVVCWNKYRCELKITNGELMHIEEKAREIGLL